MKSFSICQRNKYKGIKTWYLREKDSETKKISYKSLETTNQKEAKRKLEEAKKAYNKQENEKSKKRSIYDLIQSVSNCIYCGAKTQKSNYCLFCFLRYLKRK